MSWAKVDDQLHSNEKILDCSLAARGLWLMCLSWVADKETDGAVSRSVVKLHAGAQWQELSGELVSAGLWDVTESGWAFHDYLDCNPSRSELEEERRKTAERKARWKEKNASGTPEERRSPSVPPQSGTMLPEPEPEPVRGRVISTTLSYTQHLPEMGQSQQEQEAFEPSGSVVGDSGEAEKQKAKALPRTVSRPNSRLSCLRTVPRELAPVADWFETVFWKAYPRKESAPEAWKAIQSAFKGCTDTDGLQDLILGSLCAYKGCAQWTDATKIPHPATWLNRRPWEGDAPPVASAPPAAKGFPTAQGGGYRTPAQQAAHERGMSTANFFLDLEKELEATGALSPVVAPTLRTESRGR